MNGPEGFLPKKQNFTMQVVQVLWYRPQLSLPTHAGMSSLLKFCEKKNLELHTRMRSCSFISQLTKSMMES